MYNTIALHKSPLLLSVRHFFVSKPSGVALVVSSWNLALLVLWLWPAAAADYLAGENDEAWFSHTNSLF